MIERAWHYTTGAGPQGPVMSRQLATMLRSGTLPADTPVWTEGWAEWFPARDVEELVSAAWPAGPPAADAPALPAAPIAAPRAVRATPAAAPALAEGARAHSPSVAAVAGALVPGAGQAYNGQPFKALFVLFTAVLLLPWAWGVWDAHAVAGRLNAAGGRDGRGGAGWVFVQAWTAANFVLFLLLAATIAGWLR